MTLEEIKAAVEAGKTVYHQTDDYQVIKDGLGQWFITYLHGSRYTIGLTWRDGVTMNGKPEEFYIGEES
jgi:hypothetical protein